MKATFHRVVQIVQIPNPPPISSVSLELTVEEAKVLYDLGNWNQQMAICLLAWEYGKFPASYIPGAPRMANKYDIDEKFRLYKSTFFQLYESLHEIKDVKSGE